MERINFFCEELSGFSLVFPAMSSEAIISHIPLDLQASFWLQSVIELLQRQSKQIQEQAEQIVALKQVVKEQKDELARLRKMPKRPKFRPHGGDPKSRSGQPRHGDEGSTSNASHKMSKKKHEKKFASQLVKSPR